jgi:DNA-directed RNA polymerase specialized sigma24 family protein
MRRILVDAARGKDSLEVHEALDRLAATDREAAELVKLRFFAGFTAEQAAEALGISARSAVSPAISQ